MIEVKLAALDNDRAGPYLKRFLIGGNPFGAESPDLGMLTLAELIAELPDFGLAQYLLGRQLWIRGHFERALPYFGRARELGLSSPELRSENQRLEAISLFRLGQYDRARRAFRELADDESRPSGARARALDWIERCDWEAELNGSRGGGRTGTAARR
jgi:tetratricopeptide (TPR) repeat protein